MVPAIHNETGLIFHRIYSHWLPVTVSPICQLLLGAHPSGHSLHCHYCGWTPCMFGCLVAAWGRRHFQTHFLNKNISWWRHQMETFSALLAICAGNSPVTGEFPAQRPVTRSFDASFFVCAWINHWVNSGDAGDLRGYHAHYDVIVMVAGFKFYQFVFPIEYADSWKESVKTTFMWLRQCKMRVLGPVSI